MTTERKYGTVAGNLGPAEKSLEKRFWRNWFFMAVVLFIAIVGLGTAMPPLLSERITSPWPWVKTDLVLILGLSLVIFAFIGYLTQKQREVNRIRTAMQKLIEEKSERVRRDNARLRALLSVSQKMSMETDHQSVLGAITDACVETFCCQRASLMLVDDDNDELVVDSVSGEIEANILKKRLKIGEGIAGWAAEKKKSILIRNPDDFDRYPDLEFNNPDVISAMIVPIVLRDKVIGVINISAESQEVEYNEEDLGTLQVFAENVGACIRHKEQTDWLKAMVHTFSGRLADAETKRI